MPNPADTQVAEPKSAFEAVQLELQGEITVPDEAPTPNLPAVIDPQPTDPKPGPDSLPAVPEGDGATDPADNAPQPDAPKTDEKKTEVDTPPGADDPEVEVPGKDGGGPTKKPSDEFGELPAGTKQETQERFAKMKSSYDAVTAERDTYRETAERWVQTVKSTGCTPEQFGNVLQHMADMNSGTVEGKLRAYETMKKAVNVMAKELGQPGFEYDPLDEPANADLKEKVEVENLDPAIARELAAGRSLKRVGETLGQQSQQQVQENQRVHQALSDVRDFGNEMKGKDPQFAAKYAIIKPFVDRAVARLPPEEWLEATKEAYNNAVVAAPTPTPTPEVKVGLRPTGGPGAAPAKEPGSVLEAMQTGMGWNQG